MSFLLCQKDCKKYAPVFFLLCKKDWKKYLPKFVYISY
jgi:hypothetical protein